MIIVRTPDARGPIPVEQKSPQPLIVYLVGQSIHILERARNSEVKRVANFRVSAKSVAIVSWRPDQARRRMCSNLVA